MTGDVSNNEAGRPSRLHLTGRQTWQLALSIVATVALGSYFFATVNVQDVIAKLRAIDLFWFGMAALFMLLHTILRAIRICHVVGESIGKTALTATCAVQSFLGMLLPSGLAQAAFVYLLKKLHAVGIIRGLTSMLAMRLADLALFVMTACVAGIWLKAGLDQDLEYMALVVLGLLAISTAALVLLRMALRHRSAHRSQSMMGGLLKFLDKASTEFIQAAAHLSRPETMAITLLNWLSLFGCYAALVLSIGLELPISNGILAFALLMLINLLPVHGIAGVGTHHLAWFLVLTMVGVGEEAARLAGATSHVLLFALYAIWFVPALPVLILASHSYRKPISSSERHDGSGAVREQCS